MPVLSFQSVVAHQWWDLIDGTERNKVEQNQGLNYGTRHGMEHYLKSRCAAYYWLTDLLAAPPGDQTYHIIVRNNLRIDCRFSCN